MDLRQLEYFQMVGKLRSITRAAEQLHVSQSTVTLAIQKLEDSLAIQLFDRSQKQFSLTTEGQVFLQSVADILNRLQDATAEIQKYRQLQKGTIKVGVPPMIGSFLFPEILAQFTLLYPQLQLSIIEESSFALRQLLERGELDLGIVNLYQPTLLLETIRITTEEIVACLPLKHPMANRTTIDMKDLQNEQFILFKEGAYNRHVILEECKRHGFAPNILLSSDQIETIKGLVIKGVGISFLIRAVTRQNSDFAAIHLSNPLHLQFGLAWKKDRYLSKAAQAFIKFITEIICPPNTIR
ncbi:LysR family transcriptional regulator|uniref:DNA-binding transcriptional regulator, LysR family n=1 Tax=Dendrosporobacter quercicolus TaxID=146817 RepID=A0A1G9W2U5_9FIRM|nr:LysR family transcriptional regulator [Dendrosporobacter quercicolus]NSL47734.1 LysR family transcriptional regulator [Dendrosporobacter quercicolus DSM 1736]SDM78844.1 DNA-binding transcriptional regulator, LysR family [Dendrosporobacter quercicolus]